MIVPRIWILVVVHSVEHELLTIHPRLILIVDQEVELVESSGFGFDLLSKMHHSKVGLANLF